jgi:alpha-glucoside transport system permease protein
MRQRQLLSLGGLASVDLLLAAFAVSGDAPGTGESGAAIRAFYVEHGTDQQIGAFLLMIVPLIVFISLQRYFVQGLLAGSVK